MVAVSTAASWDQCPSQICTGTATAIKKADAIMKVCTQTANEIAMGMPCNKGCKDAKAPVPNACTGTSTSLTPAIVAVPKKTITCAFNKKAYLDRPCEWECAAKCTYAPKSYTWTGKFTHGAVAAADEQKDVACTAANARTTKEAVAACTGYVAGVCSGDSTVTMLDGKTSTTTCASTLRTCVATYNSKSCAAATGCKYAAPTYKGTEKFTIPAVVKKDGVKDTVCSAGKNDRYLNGKLNPAALCKQTTVDPTCTGTYDIPKVDAVKEGGANGAEKIGDCPTAFAIIKAFKGGVMGVKAECELMKDCTYVAGTPAVCGTGKSTVVVTAAVAKDYTPFCSRGCSPMEGGTAIAATFKNGINGNTGCAPGCTIAAPVPVVPVAPSPAKSSSASAATMAAATIALSAIAAIVAL